MRYLVVDEADRMLESGAFPELRKLESEMFCGEGCIGASAGARSETSEKKPCERRWQTLVFSATLTLRCKKQSAFELREKKKQRRKRNDDGEAVADLDALVAPLSF